VVHADFPDRLIAARLGSPLVVGVADQEYFVASDATPMLMYTKNVVFLEDGEVADITRSKMEVVNLKDQRVEKQTEQIEWNEESARSKAFRIL
jgi:glucosamine--fructose-6-phosphate aminotransferase (isomerizing)